MASFLEVAGDVLSSRVVVLTFIDNLLSNDQAKATSSSRFAQTVACTAQQNLAPDCGSFVFT